MFRHILDIFDQRFHRTSPGHWTSIVISSLLEPVLIYMYAQKLHTTSNDVAASVLVNYGILSQRTPEEAFAWKVGMGCCMSVFLLLMAKNVVRCRILSAIYSSSSSYTLVCLIYKRYFFGWRRKKRKKDSVS